MTSSGGVKSVIKIKGITFDSRVERIVDFDHLRELVGKTKTSLVPQYVFSASKADQVIFSKDTHKNLSCSSDKRVFTDGHSYPFGYSV